MTPISNQIMRVGIVVVALTIVGFGAYQIGYKNGAGSGGETQDGSSVVEAHTLLGTVEKTSGQTVTLNNVRRVTQAADSAKAETVVITIDSSTDIERLVLKDATVLSKEMAAFTKKLQGVSGTAATMVQPDPFVHQKIALSDIKIGETLSVSSSENIAKSTAFTATQIAVLPVPPSPADGSKAQ
ncbi:MAG: hypothetical protein PHD04_01910 [Candidatus Pacebacteria bacterium]|nr:hypothetical protein [Candidatus Paceibacterota bacterium]